VVNAAAAASATATSPQQQQQQQGFKFPLASTSPDPFVEASPLVVGVVCRDGVLLVALHSVFSERNDESFLLFQAAREGDDDDDDGDTDDSNDDDNDDNDDSNDDDNDSNDDNDRGPFRIHAMDASGEAAMVCSGWRTDGRVLTDHLRSFDRSENRVFGSRTSNYDNTDNTIDFSNHGGALADRAALFLAQCSVSEQKRSLACVGLLASAASSSPARNPAHGGGSLWVVDATGAYRVRAHALGRGSDTIHTLLRSKDWTRLPARTVRTELLRSLGLLPETNGSNENDNDDYNDDPTTKGSRVEMAIVESSADRTRTAQPRNRLKRLFAST